MRDFIRNLFVKPFGKQIAPGLLVLSLALLSGCGGGGGGGGAPTFGNTPTLGSTVTEMVGSGGGSVSLPDKTIVTIDPGVLKDGTRVTVSTSPSPIDGLPPEVDLVGPSIRVEIPENALQGGDLVNKGIMIEIPLPEENNGKLQALSLQEVKDQFKVVGVRIARGEKKVQGWAKYKAKQGVDGIKKAAVWVGSKSLEVVSATKEGGKIVIDTVVQTTKRCFQGLEFNKLYQIVPLGSVVTRC